MEDTARLSRALRRTRRCMVLAAALAGLAADPGRCAEESAAVLAARAHEAAARDDHDGAIRQARRSIALDPSREAELSLLLGYQLTWSERAEEAVPWFRVRLRHRPGDRSARFGLARALSWNGSLDEARELYEELHAEDPGDEEAALGIARMHAWNEDPGAAARTYQAVLARHPGSEEARRGLARARGAGRTGVDVSGARWTDVDDQELEVFTVGVSRAIGPGRRLVGQVSRVRVDEPRTPRIEALRVTGGADWRARGSLSFHGRVGVIDVGRNLAAFEAVPVGAGETRSGREVRATRAVWDTWIAWTPERAWRVDFSHARTALDTPRSLARGIRIDALGLGFDRRIGDHAVLRARGARSTYTDGNRRLFTEGELEVGPWRAARALRAWGFLGGHAFRFRESPDHGYYAPETYDSFGLRARVELSLGPRASLEGLARLATEREEESGRFGVLAGGGTLRVSLARGLGISLFAHSSTSRFDTGGGYERDGVGLSLYRES